MRWRVAFALVIGAITIWFGSFLLPIDEIRYDFSFQNSFLQFGGDNERFQEFVQEFGSDVLYNAALITVDEDSGQSPDSSVLETTIFQPEVLRQIEAIEDDLRAREEVGIDGVASVMSLPDFYAPDQIETDFVRTAFRRYERERTAAGMDDAEVLRCMKSSCPGFSAALLEAARALEGTAERVLRHKIFTRRMISNDARATLVSAQYSIAYRNEDLRQPMARWIEKQGNVWRKQLPKGVDVVVTGVPIVEYTYQRLSLGETSTLLPFSSLIIVILLWWLYRWFWAMAVPIIAVHVALVWAMGFMQATREPINLLNNVMPVIILVVGIADAVHYIARYLQEYRRLGDKREAIACTMKSMGWACFLTSATTAVGFGSLMFATIPTIRSFGLYVSISVLIAYVLSLILIPILLSVVPPPSQRVLDVYSGGFLDRFMRWVARATLSRPRYMIWVMCLFILLGVVGVVGSPVGGIGGVTSESRLMEEIRPEQPIYQATKRTQERLSGLLVHALYVRGRTVEGKNCETNKDCLDPGCDVQACECLGADCMRPSCCDALLCRRSNVFTRYTKRLSGVIQWLTDMNDVPVLVQLEGMGRSLPQRAADGNDEELDFELEEDDSEPVESTSLATDGECIYTTLDPRLIGRLEGLSQSLLRDERFQSFITRIDDLASLTREMLVAMSPPEEQERLLNGPYPFHSQQALAQILLPLRQNGSEMVDKVQTPDGTGTQVSFIVSDEGTHPWQKLRAELQKFRDEIKSDPVLGPRFDVYITGSSTLAQDALGHVVGDLLTSLALAFCLIAVLMTVLFRSIRIGLVSMIPNVFPLGMTIGFMGYLDVPIRAATAIIFSISLGIAVDDTIHFLERFREERRKTNDVNVALENTLFGTGRAIVLTTLVLVAGFGVCLFSEFVAMYQFGYLTAFTLTMALFADVFLLPALITLFRLERGIRKTTPEVDAT
ncbi:MAG: hypothetical protein CMH54_03645 [Myxococcales bacterium]|nr:hypothetical protein [Myxococcales bacterium]